MQTIRIAVTLCLAIIGIALAQAQSLTLDSCRALALSNNKELAISRAKMEKATWERKAAHTNYLPKISAVAGYLRSGSEVSLLNSDQKTALAGIGTQGVSNFTNIASQIVTQHPDLAPLVQSLQGYLPTFATAGNNLGQSIADALRTDTRNMTAGAILLTQPLYMGGKIQAYDRITRHSEQLAQLQSQAASSDIILNVDKAYWQVVSLSAKRRLAVSYRDMLAHLDADVLKMIDEGVATRSNELNVSVKLNEAEMTLTKIDDGLQLSRMLLCQLCGLPLTSQPTLADEQTDNLPTQPHDVSPDVQTAFSQRPELAQLATAQKIYDEKIRIERAAYLPQLALMGGYMLSNPNVFNGFERKFRGTWGVGVTLKVPVWNWGEGRDKVRAAKADAQIAALRSEEAREKVELQVNQETFRLNEANRKLQLSLKNLNKADENLRTAQVGFREGVVNTSDLLAAQTAWLQANSDKIDAQIDIRLARATYDKAIGNTIQ